MAEQVMCPICRAPLDPASFVVTHKQTTADHVEAAAVVSCERGCMIALTAERKEGSDD